MACCINSAAVLLKQRYFFFPVCCPELRGNHSPDVVSPPVLSSFMCPSDLTASVRLWHARGEDKNRKWHVPAPSGREVGCWLQLMACRSNSAVEGETARREQYILDVSGRAKRLAVMGGEGTSSTDNTLTMSVINVKIQLEHFKSETVLTLSAEHSEENRQSELCQVATIKMLPFYLSANRRCVQTGKCDT